MRVLDEAPRPQPAIDCAAVAARCDETVTGVEFYRDLEGRGFELGPRLRRIAEIRRCCGEALATLDQPPGDDRSEEHTSELQSLMRISYAVFCLKKKTQKHNHSK